MKCEHDGWRPPACVIETPEELAAVAPMTVVRAADGTIAGRHPSGVGVVFGDERPFDWSLLRPPATVLWSPEGGEVAIEWRPVVSYEGRYEVSSDGQVRSLRRQSRRADGTTQWIPPRMLKQSVRSTGYRSVTLCADGKRLNHAVHRLVATAFIRPPMDGEAVCHGDGDKLNNSVQNLRWGSSSDNQLDNVRLGRHHYARKTHCPQGHEYNDENMYRQANGYRQCKACGRERDHGRRKTSKPEEAR